MASMLPDNRRQTRPDWGLLAVVILFVGCAAGIMLSLLGVKI
jgi:hypothetical protein